LDPAIRRIIAVDAHRRRTGRCPTAVHSLGTGETYQIAATRDGFVDVDSGLAVRVEDTGLKLPQGRSIDLEMVGDIAFSGYDYFTAERFTGRAGGGVSVTVYDSKELNYFQYAIAD
jgi:hypothetical protein